MRRGWAFVQGRRPELVTAAVAGAVVVFVQARLSRAGIQSYGYDGAQYIEHAARLRAVRAMQEISTHGLRGALAEADGDYPPAVHLLTSCLAWIGGHDALAAARTSVLWLLLMAGAAALIAWRIDGRRATAAAAAIGCLLVPALHGASARYYYDLPFLALLWVLVPVGLATWDRRPLAGGLAVGGLWLLACLTKWTAIPLGGVAALAVAVGPGPADRRRRGIALVTAGLAVAIGVGLWVRAIGDLGSLGGMLANWVGTLGGEGGESGGLGGLVTSGAAAVGGLDPLARLQYYGLALFFSILSPLLAGLAVLLGGIWLVRGGRGAPSLVVLAGGQLAFAVAGVAVFDERFVLGVAPAFAVAGALGWARLPERSRAVAGALVVALGLLVGLEAQHGVPATTAPVRLIENRAPDSFPNTSRGIWVSDSIERRGWGHWDPADGREHARLEALWAAVLATGPDAVLVVGDPDLDTAALDSAWLGYRALLAAVRGEPRIGSVAFGHDCGEADLLVRRVDPRTGPASPCAAPWTLQGVLPAGDGSFDVSFWVPASRAAGR